MKRILIINIFGIGDVLFTTPVISNLKENYPDSFIGYVVNARAFDIINNNPKVDKVILYEKDEYRELYKKSKFSFLKKVFNTLSSIKKDKYDIVVDLSLNRYASFFMWFIGIPVRLGFNYKGRGCFLSNKLPLKGYDNKHVIEYYLSLLKECGLTNSCKNMEIFCKKDDNLWADEYYKSHISRSSDSLVVGIFPGGGSSWGKDAGYKHWTSSKYAQLADKIIEQYSAKVVFFGSNDDKEICGRIIDLMKYDAISVCGKITIHQCSALVKKCAIVILNDGGPLHISVASNVRTLSVFGSVDENVYGPYPKDRHKVVTADIACRPCYRRFKRADCNHISCLNRIKVEDVFNKFKYMMDLV